MEDQIFSLPIDGGLVSLNSAFSLTQSPLDLTGISQPPIGFSGFLTPMLPMEELGLGEPSIATPAALFPNQIEPSQLAGEDFSISALDSLAGSTPGVWNEQQAYGQLPLQFIPNVGQSESTTQFQSLGAGQTLLFGTDGLTLQTSQSTEAGRQSTSVDVNFVGANADVSLVGQGQRNGTANFLLGSDEQQWQTEVPTFAALMYNDLYDGIDLVYSSENGQLKSEFIVAPQADPNQILLDYDGIAGLRIRSDGALVLQTELGELVEAAPYLYQEIGGQRVEVAGQYQLFGNDWIGYAIGDYDPTYSLVIDPILAYTSYLGGSGKDSGYDIAVSSNGEAYLVGQTSSVDFPGAGANSGGDLFVAKLSADGQALDYVTYLSGSGVEQGTAIAVDDFGQVYVTGTTNSLDFPTVNSSQSTFGGGDQDAFLLKLGADGSTIDYGTYLGGSGTDIALDLAVTETGQVTIVGSTDSPDLPLLNAFQQGYGGDRDAFIAQFDASGTRQTTTYYGGSGDDVAHGVDLDGTGQIYIAGETSSLDLALVNALQESYGGGESDAFLAYLSADGTTLKSATYLGGSGDDAGLGIAVDAAGKPYVTGQTSSTDWETINAFQFAYGGGDSDAFVSKFAAGITSVLYSSYLGGDGTDKAQDIAVDTIGSAYVTGTTNAADFPTVNPLQLSLGTGDDAFVSRINPSGSALSYSTFLGGNRTDEGLGIALDPDRNVYVVGQTDSNDLLVANALQPLSGGDTDVFVSKLTNPDIQGDFDGDTDVDFDDLSFITSAFNQQAIQPGDPRDLDGDRRITVLDARKLALLFQGPQDIIAPALAVGLANDTGISPSDLLTADGTLVGSVSDASGVSRLLAGINDGPLRDVTLALQPDSSFFLTPEELAILNEGTLSDGDHTVVFRATDTVGNISGLFPFTFTLDTTPPPLLVDLDLAFDSDVVGDRQTTFEKVTLTGETEPGLTIILMETGENTTADGNGQFSFNDVDLAVGSNEFTFASVDRAGNATTTSLSLERVQPNQAPIVNPDKTLTVDEDSGSTALGITAPTDADGDGDDLTITIATIPESSQGEIELADGSVVTVGQTLSNSDLEGLQFIPRSNANGDAGSFSYTVTDGQGGSASQTITLAITPVNDRPALTVPNPLVTPENTDLPITGISVSDIDLEGGDVEVSLAVTEGLLSLGGTTGLAFSTGDSSNGATFVFTGSLEAVNTALGSLSYRSEVNFDGIDILSLSVNDLGNTGTGGALSDSQTVEITVSATNVNPVVNPDKTLTVDEDSGETALGITAPTDLDGDDLTITIATIPESSQGDIALADGSVVAVGQTLSSSDLEGLQFVTRNNANGEAGSFSYTVTDGQGGSASQTIILAITPVNDAPLVVLPGNQTVDENTDLAISGININDIDVGDGNLQVTLTANNGVLSLSQTTGLGFDTGDGIEDSALTFTGTLADINAALATLTYRSEPGFAGQDKVSLVVNDQGNTGTNGALEASGEIVVDVTAVGITLQEESFFQVVHEEPIIIPDGPSVLTFTLNDPAFDLTDDFINDAFEAALVDAEGNSLVHTIASNRDAFLNLTEGEAQKDLASGVTIDEQTVTVNLAGIPAGTEATLLLRLVNNDGDTQSSVQITNIDVVAADVSAPGGVTPTLATLELQKEIAFEGLSDVSSSMTVQYGQTSLNDDDNRLFADMAIQNTGTYGVDGPLVVAVTNLSDPTVQTLDADGVTPEGLPYYVLDLVGDQKALLPGETSAQGTLQFANSNGGQFTYELVVLGNLNEAPEILTEPNVEGLVGQQYRYDVDAIDPEDDPVTYSLVVAPEGMTIDENTGEIEWSPAETDLGTQSVTVQVSDGRGGVTEQSFDVVVGDAPPNRPPIFTTGPVVDARVNTAYSYDADATDLDGDGLTYALMNGPEGMTIDPTTGEISWTPTAEQIAGDKGEGDMDPTLPLVDGFTTDIYVEQPGLDPAKISFDPAGTLYIGRDNSGSGGEFGDAVRIHKVIPGSKIIEEFGDNAIPDPDVVLFDEQGTISGVPGAVLVGGNVPGIGRQLSAISPDGTVNVLFTAGGTGNLDISSMILDKTGRLLFTNENKVFVVEDGTPSLLFEAPGGGLDDQNIAVDSNNRIYSGDTDGVVRVYNAEGQLLDDAFATGLGTAPILEFGPGGVWGNDLYAINRESGELIRIDSEGNQTVIGTGFLNAFAPDITFGPDGALYLNDFNNDRILRITPNKATLGLDPSEHPVTITVADGKGGVAVQNYVVNVLPEEGNHDPVIISEPETTLIIPPGYQGKTWNFAEDFELILPQVGNGEDNAWFYYRAEPDDHDGEYTLFDAAGPGVYSSDFYSHWGPNAFHLVGRNFDGSGWAVPGTFNFNNPASNPEPDTIIGFRAPTSATYSISGLFRDRDGQDWDGPIDQRGVYVDITTTKTPGIAGSDINISEFDSALLDASNTNEWMRTELGNLEVLPDEAPFDFDIFLEEGQTLFFRVNDLGSNRFDSTQLEIEIGDVVTYEYDVDAIDPDDDALTYSLVEAPEGMEINPDTGVINWQPTEQYLPENDLSRQVVQWSSSVGGNDHYYELINDTITWTEAREAAAELTYKGSEGHLVTITSPEENEFLTTLGSFNGFAWIGGSDEAQEGVWQWVVGPEAGTQFWSGGPGGTQTTYANWGPVEPNNRGNEAFSGINLGTTSAAGTQNGQWGDTKNSAGNFYGYIVEYSDVPDVSTDVTVRVEDGRGGSDEQEFTIQIGDGNLKPEIVSDPVVELTVPAEVFNFLPDTVDVFDTQEEWLSTINAFEDNANVETLSFSNSFEENQTRVNDTDLSDYYASLGVEFSPFANGDYPHIIRNQNFQRSNNPNDDGMLSNTLTPNPGGIGNHTIEATFTVPVYAVGLYTNDFDGGVVRAYDEFDNLIAIDDVGNSGGLSSNFGGIVSDTVIKRVEIENLFNGDRRFAIYDFQFATQKPIDPIIYNYDVDAIDPDNDALNYSLLEAPVGMVIDEATGEVSWSPFFKQITESDEFQVTVGADDGRGGSDEQSFTIQVIEAPDDVDLTIDDVTPDNLVVNGQTLALSGSVTAEVTNQGSEDLTQKFGVIFFDDSNANQSYDEGIDNVLGISNITDSLAAGASQTVTADLTGNVSFSGAPIWAFVDSDDAVIETDETNNLAFSSKDCIVEPGLGEFDPVVEWNKREFTVEPESNQVIMTPAVIDVNEDGIPDVIFSTFTGNKYSTSKLRAISGEDGSEIWTVTDPAHEVYGVSSLAVGDIDNDGLPEIIAVHKSDTLIAFEHDGSFKWQSERAAGYIGWGGAALADLDGDGSTEVIVGASAFDNEGNTLWHGNLLGGLGRGDNGLGTLSTVADLDLDGTPEVIAGKSAYRADGSVYWNASIGDGFSAIGNFDDDPNPEVVVVSAGRVHLLEHTGELKWGNVVVGGGRYGPPTIADLDGDGEPEIGVASANVYFALETDGTLKWLRPVRDASSNVTGSSVFDFDGDGQVEVVYGDEHFLRIYNGSDGEVLYELPKGSGTAYELPVIADVDADGNAEIIAVANDYIFGNERGIFVIGDRNDTWVATRQIWNQHAYSINHVNDDGSIPANPENSWQTHNTFRLNAFPEGEGNALAAPDLIPSYVRLEDSGTDATITTRIGNGGSQFVAAGVNVSFYNGDPNNGGILLGTTQTTSRLDIGTFEDVSLTVPAGSVELDDIWVVADDDGTGQGFVTECDEENNVYHVGSQTGEPVEPTGNQEPEFTSTPLETATAGQRFRYNANAQDADGDALTYDLSLHPEGMAVDSTSGIVVWNPNINQLGDHDVILRVQDGNGGVNLQSFQVTVDANTAPVITSLPFGPTIANTLYQYDVDAEDADGDALTYSLLTGPDGATIDPISGLLNWTPSNGDVGGNFIRVRVDDEQGGFDTQSFTLPVLASAGVNNPPTITNTPRGAIGLGDDYVFQIEASDPDNDPLTYSLIDAPEGMTIDQNGLILWPAASTQLGDYSFTVQVQDARGAGLQATYDLSVVQQTVNNAPTITSIPAFVATIDDQYIYQAEATDPDNDPIAWSLVSGPSGLTLDETTGRISWVPTEDQFGFHVVTIEAIDAQGATVQQGFGINVSSTNAPPQITSAPETLAYGNQTYSYDLQAFDPNGDALTYSLTAAPEGMTIDPASGLIEWTPTATQVGPQEVTVNVSDSKGGTVAQTYNLNVVGDGPNLPPKFTSRPDFGAIAEQPYSYQLVATDPENLSLRYELLQGPAGMTVDEVTGELSWTPTADQIGPQRVQVAAFDPLDVGASQTFTVTVGSGNQNPVLNNTPNTTALIGETYAFDLNVSDPDGDAVNYTLVDGPEGMTIDNQGRLRWTPEAGDVGTNRVDLLVEDGRGGNFTFGYDLRAIADTTAPQVAINVSANPVDIDESVVVQVNAVDDVAVAEVGLTVDGLAVALDSNGSTVLDFDTISSVSLVGTALDTSGNAASTDLSLSIVDTSDVNAPIVSILTPGDGDSITSFVDVIGTVDDPDDNLVSYTLTATPLAGGPTTVLSEGTDEITGDVLGEFDGTLLRNDSYVLELSATDAGGNTASTSRVVDVEGDLKIGNYTLSFVDLSIPLTGIPIVVSRTYDTLNANINDDFGYGWSMDLRDTDLTDNVGKSGLEDSGIYNAFFDGAAVYITLPNGEREKFIFQPQARGLFGLTTYKPRFVAADGDNTSVLTVDDIDLQRTADGRYVTLSQIPYNPASTLISGTSSGNYTLTTKDGIKYTIDGDTGDLEKITDRNGNTLTYTEDGVFSSTGQQVTFERNPQGRITAVIDPEGNRITYEYDALGDLVIVINQVGNQSKFSYDTSHRILDINDSTDTLIYRGEYDDNGRLVSIVDSDGNTFQMDFNPNSSTQVITDPRGNNSVYELDERGNVLSIIDANGNTESISYDVNDNVISTTDKLGNITFFTYDNRGNILNVADPLGSISHFTYNSFNQLTSSTDSNGNTISYVYSSTGNLISEEDALGNITSYTYDSKGNITSILDAEGNISRLEYDAFGNITKVADTFGNFSTMTYDMQGNLTSLTDSRGQTTQYEYDSLGRQVRIVDALGNVTQQEWNEFGEMSALTDELGNRIEVVSNNRQIPLEITQSDGSSIFLEYNANDILESSNAPNEFSSSITYNKVDNPTEVLLSDGTRMSFEYDAEDRLLSTTDQNGNRSNFEYNIFDQIVIQKDPLGNQTKLEYDKIGNLVSVTDANGNTTQYEHDANGRIISTTFPNGLSEKFSYNSVGDLVEEEDAAGNITKLTYDSERRLTSVINSNGAETLYEYDSNGSLTKMIDALGREIKREYDELNRPVKIIYPDGSYESFTYQGIAQLKTKTEQNGNITTYEYDSKGQITKVQYSDSTSIKYTYDLFGRLDVVEDSNGITDFEYDELGRLLQISNPDGSTISYTYDEIGNRTNVVTADGTTQYSYDESNRLVQVIGSDAQITTYEYDAVGNVTHIKYPNGIVTSTTYDELNRITSIATRNADNNVIFQETYILDELGNHLRVTETDGTSVEYNYDSLSQLIGEIWKDKDGMVVDEIKYTYDLVGNRLTSSRGGISTIYNYDSNNYLLSSGENSYEYDSNGNTVAVVTSSGTTNYVYDVHNRLVQVSLENGDTWDYEYDFSGNRIGISTPEVSVDYLVDVNSNIPNILVSSDQEGNIISKYTYGLDLVSQDHGGENIFYHHDALGSTRVLTDESGFLNSNYTYSAFGELLDGDVSKQNDFYFAGEQFDDQSGLYYLRNRYYDPVIGRFLSKDKLQGNIIDPITTHKFIYANNNPVNLIDPLGLQASPSGSVGTGYHNRIGRDFLRRWGDYFLDLGYSRNSSSYINFDGYAGGFGAYNRRIQGAAVWSFLERPDLRNYATGDVYEIKNFNPSSIIKGLKQVERDIFFLNAFPDNPVSGSIAYLNSWHKGWISYAVRPPATFTIPGTSTQVFAPPAIPLPGLILYSRKPQNDVNRVLRKKNNVDYRVEQVARSINKEINSNETINPSLSTVVAAGAGAVLGASYLALSAIGKASNVASRSVRPIGAVRAGQIGAAVGRTTYTASHGV